MNNLVKILIPFFFIVSLYADQGRLTAINPVSIETNATSVIDMSLIGTDLYLANSTQVYKYNISGTALMDLNISGVTKLKATQDNVVCMKSSSIEIYDRNLTSKGSSASSTKTFQALDLSEDDNYVFVATSTGVMVIDISTPAIPKEVAFIETTNARDLKVKGDYLYVADDWGGLKVVDISNPVVASVVSTSSGTFYNLALENNRLYTVGANGLSIFDISSPVAPLYKSNFASYVFNTATQNINIPANIYVQDMYAYVGKPFNYIFDVSNSSNIKTLNNTNKVVSSIVGDGDNLFIATSAGSVYKATPESDFDNNASASSLYQKAKTTTDLGINGGVFGSLKDATDIDYVKLLLTSGYFNATISGLKDLNVSLYDTNNTNASPLVSFQSDPASPTSVKFSSEVKSGIYYMRVESLSGGVGEYRISAKTNVDDWTDNKNSALLINIGEKIDGNMLNASDRDYFRVDFTSKGELSFTSDYGGVIDIEIENSYDATLITGVGDFVTGKKYVIPSAGTYFVRVKAATTDVLNQTYAFRTAFSKDAVLSKEDNARFALKLLDSNTTTAMNYEQIKSEENYLYVVDNTSYYLYRKNKTDLTNSSSYGAFGPIIDYEIVGDYIYILLSSDLLILYKDSMSLRKQKILSGSYNKLKVNGDFVYLHSTNNPQTIDVGDISDKDNPLAIGSINLENTINDFDIKTSFDTTLGKLKTYIYSATNSGIEVYDYTVDLTTIPATFSPQKVHTYKQDVNFHKIFISGYYAYVAGDDGFSILYVKRPTSTPKIRGNLSIRDIVDITINQDFAYLITNNNTSTNNFYLKVINIKDSTNPFELDIGAISARSIYVEDGLGYLCTYSDLITKTEANTLKKYDMEKDYADIKGLANKIDYTQTNYGVISKYDADEKDIFYINAQNSIQLNLSVQGDINTSYQIFSFNNDVLKGNFNALTSETNTSFNLEAGEYYLQITSTDGVSGAYEFNASVVKDDYADNFTEATLINFNQTYGANMTATDIDAIKINITQRGEFIFKTDVGITSQIFYEDESTTIATSDSNGILKVTLNPGTYYIEMTGSSSTSYSFSATTIDSEELSSPDGFDGIKNFNATHILNDGRYLYVVNKSNQLAIYNHLLQQVAKGDIVFYSGYNGERGFNHYCGKPIFSKATNRIFINTTKFDTATGSYKCGKGFKGIFLEYSNDNNDRSDGYNVDNYDLYMTFSYIFNSSYEYQIEDASLVGSDNAHLYIFSDQNNTIFKVDASTDFWNHGNPIDPKALFSVAETATIDDIKSIKNDGTLDFIAVSNILSLYETNPNYVAKDVNGNVIDNRPQILNSKKFTLSGNIVDMHLDREAQKLYVLSASSTLVTIVDYSLGIANATTSTIDLATPDPTSMFVKKDTIYISFKEYGIKSYSYPLVNATEILDIPNIGTDISKPFSYDRTTLVYLSDANPQVYYLSDRFIDGTTSGTYTTVSDVKEGQGGFEGCFIATASYGNYFEPNVKVLRDFRDKYLLNNEFGRLFVDFYYKHSPAIAAQIAHSQVAKAFVRTLLTPIVYTIKYPSVALLLLFMILLGIGLRKNLNLKKVLLLSFLFISLSFTGCGQDNASSNSSQSPPILRDFVIHISETSTNPQSLGKVEAISEGGANIKSFRLEGMGYTNFKISKSGEITTLATTTLDFNTTKVYHLKAIATNDYGESNHAKVMIQVTNATQPILDDLVVNINDYESSFNYYDENGTYQNVSMKYSTTGSGANIKNYEVVGNIQNFYIDTSTGRLSLNNPLGNSVLRYDLLVRAINDLDVVGPYATLTIFVNDTGSSHSDTGTTTNTVNDDYPDDIYSAQQNIGFSYGVPQGTTHTIQARMDFDYDYDSFGVYIAEPGFYTFQLNNNGNLFSFADGTNTIIIYDINRNEVTRGQGALGIDIPTAGVSYVQVLGSSDYYELQIIKEF